MTSENFLKGTGKVGNTNGGYYCSLGDEVAEKVPCSHFPKLSELLMIMSIDEAFFEMCYLWGQLRCIKQIFNIRVCPFLQSFVMSLGQMIVPTKKPLTMGQKLVSYN